MGLTGAGIGRFLHGGPTGGPERSHHFNWIVGPILRAGTSTRFYGETREGQGVGKSVCDVCLTPSFCHTHTACAPAGKAKGFPPCVSLLATIVPSVYPKHPKHVCIPKMDTNVSCADGEMEDLHICYGTSNLGSHMSI